MTGVRPLPICYGCRHVAGDAMTCAAFPAGIPLAVLYSELDHRKPVAGDGGITFEPVDLEAVEYAEERFRYGVGPLPDEELSRPVDQRAMRRGRDLLTRGRVGRRGRSVSSPLWNLTPARTSVTRWGGSTVVRLGLVGRGLARRSLAGPYFGWPRRAMPEADWSL